MRKTITKTIKYQNYDIKLINHPKSRHIKLSVSSKGVIKLTKPKYVRNSEIKKFLIKHNDWLKKVMSRIPENQLKNNFQIKPNSNLLVNGEDYTFQIINIQVNQTQKVKIDEAEKIIYIFQLQDQSNKDKQEIIEKLVTQLKKISRKVFESKSNYWALKMGTKFNKISIRSQKTRWGSCSSAGNLNYNWKLILAPREILEYVVIHEVAHLIEHNHSKNFWNLVEKHYQNYKSAKNWLKHNGNSLSMFDL